VRCSGDVDQRTTLSHILCPHHIADASAGPAPITAADTFLTRVSTTAGPINVLANDVTPLGGSPIDPASVIVTAGTGGTPAFNAATRSVTYAAPAVAGTYTFT
jgi:hypothetical protein